MQKRKQTWRQPRPLAAEGPQLTSVPSIAPSYRASSDCASLFLWPLVGKCFPLQRCFAHSTQQPLGTASWNPTFSGRKMGPGDPCHWGCRLILAALPLLPVLPSSQPPKENQENAVSPCFLSHKPFTPQATPLQPFLVHGFLCDSSFVPLLLLVPPPGTSFSTIST